MLVMYAHGYAGEGANLSVSPPAIRRHLLSQGYAWAASSYSKNYYDVRAGVEDTNALAIEFVNIARQNGRTLAAPFKTYIMGVSMGGHITAAAVDEENIATAVNRIRYNGAVPMCGVLGDTELFDYFAAYQTAAQVEAGMPATSWPVANWSTIGPQVQAKLFSSFPGGTPNGPAVPTAQGLRLKQIVQNLTGGTRPLFDFAYAGAAAKHGLGRVRPRRQGQRHPERRRACRPRTSCSSSMATPAISAEEQAYNASIYRVQGSRRSKPPAPRRPALDPEDERPDQGPGRHHPHPGRHVRALQDGADLQAPRRRQRAPRACWCSARSAASATATSRSPSRCPRSRRW